MPEVDLVIRTGGERRLSDFLLWESAFAELYFTDRMWPEFTAEDLGEAMAKFEKPNAASAASRPWRRRWRFAVSFARIPLPARERVG